MAFNFLYLLPCKVTTLSFLMMYSSSSLCTLTYVLSSSIHFVTYTHNHILLLPNIFFMSIRVGKLNWLLMGCCKLCNNFFDESTKLCKALILIYFYYMGKESIKTYFANDIGLCNILETRFFLSVAYHGIINLRNMSISFLFVIFNFWKLIMHSITMSFDNLCKVYSLLLAYMGNYTSPIMLKSLVKMHFEVTIILSEERSNVVETPNNAF